MTLLEIRTLFRDYVDDVNSDRWSDAAANRFVNEAQRHAQRVIDEADEAYFLGCVTYSVTSTTDAMEFALPKDFKTLASVERIVDGSAPIPGERVAFSARHDFYDSLNPYSFETPRYYLRGAKIGIVAPKSGYTLRVFYNRRLADLSTDSQESAIPAEHHGFLAIHAAVLALGSEGREVPGPLAREHMAQKESLATTVEARDRYQPRRVHYVDDSY